MDLDRGRLEGEGFGLGEGVVFGCELGAAVVFAVLGVVDGIVADVGREGGGHGGFLEARGVGGGLGAELGQVEIRPGLVADVHRLVQSALGVEAVEDDGIDGDGDDLHDDLDEGADERPILNFTVSRRASSLRQRGFISLPGVGRSERSPHRSGRRPSVCRRCRTTPTCLGHCPTFCSRSKLPHRSPT